ncbi:MAG: hypothetical protein P8N19_10125 [Flavobacteriales bacterium]|nr:hypothetical protein [Flavobacteriales bacterium]
MPLTQCLFHQLENNHLLLLQGTEVYIDPDELSPLKLIEWAFEQKLISNTEQLALLHIVNSLDQRAPPTEAFTLRIKQLKSEKESWAYSTCENLSDPASRMHDHLLDFRNNSNIDAQIAFDQIGIVFNQTNGGLSPHRTATLTNLRALTDLVNWFEERMNILVTFSEFPDEEIDQDLSPEMEEMPDKVPLKEKNDVLKPTSKNE